MAPAGILFLPHCQEKNKENNGQLHKWADTTRQGYCCVAKTDTRDRHAYAPKTQVYCPLKIVWDIEPGCHTHDARTGVEQHESNTQHRDSRNTNSNHYSMGECIAPSRTLLLDNPLQQNAQHALSVPRNCCRTHPLTPAIGLLLVVATSKRESSIINCCVGKLRHYQKASPHPFVGGFRP